MGTSLPIPEFGPPIDVRAHFLPERRGLIELLSSLQPDEWWLPTVCGDWTVHDVAIHLLGADVNILSSDRDDFRGSPLTPSPGTLGSWAELVAFIDHRNATWVEGLRRISPGLIIELLQWTGERLASYWPTVTLDALGIPVSWAGPEPAPAWLHVARELTERWTHQHHIRDATGRAMLDDEEMTATVLDTFARALPFALGSMVTPPGEAARLTVNGAGGGQWTVVRGADGWRFDVSGRVRLCCEVRCSVDTAWRAFTLGLSAGERRQAMVFTGDQAIAERIVDMVTIIG